MARGKVFGLQLRFKPETPRDAKATQEARDGFRRARYEHQVKGINDQIGAMGDRLEALRNEQQQASEQGRWRDAARADRLAKQQQAEIDRAKAKRDAKEKRQQEYEAWRERKEKEKADREREREEQREREREERERRRRERRDKASKRPKGKPQGGVYIISTDLETGQVVAADSFGLLSGLGDDVDPDTRKAVEEALEQQVGGEPVWSTFGDWTAANMPVPNPGEPGAETYEAHAVMVTAAVNATMDVVNGLCGGPEYFDGNIGAVSHSRPGKSATGSRLGTVTTAFPGETTTVGRSLQDAALQATSTLVAHAQSVIRASGVALFEVVREHRGDGTIVDKRPAIMVENRGVALRQNGLESTGPLSFASDPMLRGTIGAGGEMRASAVAVESFAGESGDKFRIGDVEQTAARTQASVDLSVDRDGRLTTYQPQQLSDVGEHPEANTDCQLYNVSGVPYVQLPDGTQVDLSQAGSGTTYAENTNRTIQVVPGITAAGSANGSALFFGELGPTASTCSLGASTTVSDPTVSNGYHTLGPCLRFLSNPGSSTAGGSISWEVGVWWELPDDFVSWQDDAIQLEWSCAGSGLSGDVNLNLAVYGKSVDDYVEDQLLDLIDVDMTPASGEVADLDNVSTVSASALASGPSEAWQAGDQVRMGFTVTVPTYSTIQFFVGALRLNYVRAPLLSEV